MAGDKFMPEMYLRQPGFTLKKTKNEFMNLKKQEIHVLFIKTN